MSSLPDAPLHPGSEIDLAVSLPPEILAMMAAHEVSPEAGADEAGEPAPEALSLEAPSFEAPALETFAAGIPADEPRETLVLPAVLDLTAAAALHTALLARRGTALTLDAGSVRRLGGQCLQLLVSAERTWAADGVPIALGPASEAFERDLALLGLKTADLFQPEAA